MKKNELVEITITGYTAEGSGVGRWNGMAVFIPMAAVGDVLEVRILKVAKPMPLEKSNGFFPHRPQGSNPTVPNLPNAADVFFATSVTRRNCAPRNSVYGTPWNASGALQTFPSAPS